MDFFFLKSHCIYKPSANTIELINRRILNLTASHHLNLYCLVSYYIHERCNSNTAFFNWLYSPNGCPQCKSRPFTVYSSYSCQRGFWKYTSDYVVSISPSSNGYSHHAEQNQNPFHRLSVVHGLAPDYFSDSISYYSFPGSFHTCHSGLCDAPSIPFSTALLHVPLPWPFFLLMFSCFTTSFASFMPSLQCHLLRDASSD